MDGTGRRCRSRSGDEWPQIIAEYENRKAGGSPRYHYVGHRPLNETSHALMDESWARGEIPTDQYKRWVGDVKHNDPGAFYSEFFTHGNARGYSGGETNPDFRRGRVEFDLGWKAKASLQGESRVLRRSRVLRAKELVKFLVLEGRELVRRPADSSGPAAAASGARPEVFTPEVVAALSDFTKPTERRSPTARGETTPDQVRASANEVANTVARALPPPVGASAVKPPGQVADRPHRNPGERPTGERTR
ncbi:hypothetical protein [Kribbella endophytica]